ncbi:hypothetical protein AGR4A_Cc190095 [Agrobacterium tumefaciens str. B6]|uniref:Uncharacterized protein n=1 Tax=Agrobacterium tumefaciens str. B6 TaxID=1183423 RepID=A0A822UYK3_AGRTU|nr:hypothetical protein AGR4A_Cc190095 [Agrobacterium tumefaciens str. B6]
MRDDRGGSRTSIDDDAINSSAGGFYRNPQTAVMILRKLIFTPGAVCGKRTSNLSSIILGLDPRIYKRLKRFDGDDVAFVGALRA